MIRRLAVPAVIFALASPVQAQDQSRDKDRVPGAPAPKSPAPAKAPAANPKRFDGTWNVRVSCPDARDAKGYVLTLVATVADGNLRGVRRRPGQEGYLELTGRIAPDGTATLVANGLTGDPDTAVGRVKRTTPYSYTVRGKFDEKSGSGTRVELRPCDLSFTKA